MSFIGRKGLLDVVSICMQAKRFRGKINIQKPRAPHFDEALLLAATKPYFIKPEAQKAKDLLCGHELEKLKENTTEINHLQAIYAKELYERFQQSKLIVFYHKNSISAEHEFNAYVAFHKLNMEYKIYGKETLRMAIGNTPYKAVLDFYVSHNAIVFSSKPDIKKLLRVNKKFPQLVLLAAIYEDRFISKDQLVDLAKIPDIQAARAELVHTLSSVGSNLVNNLGANQQILVSQLEERGKQLEQDDKK